MLLHTILIPILGTIGVLAIMGGLLLIVRPRRLWVSWFLLERRWRSRRFGGDWSRLERALRGRGYFWVPRDIELRSPEDVYAYALSGRFWRSGYSWFVRLLSGYAGLLLIFFGLVILSAGTLDMP